ncbi:MAG: alpha/beta fold hydrolase [Candidatus Curtissbacteria bacterium]|nr:alpha/beta fold hydrolase [Candidatus Curtissbacteria bacterium]
MYREERRFKNSRSLTLAAIYEGKNKNAPVVIMCHGYSSSKTRPSTRTLAKRLTNAGLSVYRFDFTGNGKSEGNLKNLTPIVGLDDLKSAIKDLGRKDFALFGSSFGGYVALLYALENPIMALALRAPVSSYPAVYEPKYKEEMKKIVKEVAAIDIYKEAKNIKCPVQITHGDADDVVPIAQSKKLLESLSGIKQLEIIKGSRHAPKGKYLSKSNRVLAQFLTQTLLK